MFFIPVLAVAAELAVPTLAAIGLVAVNTSASIKKARRKKVCVPINQHGKYFAGVLVDTKDLRDSSDLRIYKGYLKKNADKMGLSKHKKKSLGI